MIYNEIHKDLFTVSDNYYLAHCISSDCAMGMGIAVYFQKRFHIRNILLALSIEQRQYPTCIRVDRVFNLITKKFYYGKPTYDTLTKALTLMKEQSIKDGIDHIAMPRIGCRLDKLNWSRVREIIKEVFADTDIDILVCYQ